MTKSCPVRCPLYWVSTPTFPISTSLRIGELTISGNGPKIFRKSDTFFTVNDQTYIRHQLNDTLVDTVITLFKYIYMSTIYLQKTKIYFKISGLYPSLPVFFFCDVIEMCVLVKRRLPRVQFLDIKISVTLLTYSVVCTSPIFLAIIATMA